MELVKTRQKEKVTRFSFPPVPRSGKVVVSIKGVSKGFDNTSLYRDLNLAVLRGEKIAIIGPNGSGKTTLLRMLAREIEPDKGRMSLGHGVTMSYFAQHHSDMLDSEKTVIQEVYSTAQDETVGFIRNVCGAFLFSGEDVDKVIGVLSGGERARVSLAKLLVRPGNLMVMDEPTNHLDIASSEALINALSEYSGTLLFVSHNQSFINRLATKIWDIRDQTVVEYPGNLKEYDFYNASRADESGQTAVHEVNGKKEAPVKKARDRKKEKRAEAERRQLAYDTMKPIMESVERLEEKIEDLESKREAIEKTLADPDFFSDKNRSVPLLSKYKTVREELDDLLLEWEQELGTLEKVKRELGVRDQ
jgi:ATP-binding cassette subfamily F protein 3